MLRGIRAGDLLDRDRPRPHIFARCGPALTARAAGKREQGTPRGALMTDRNGTTFLSGANAEFIAELYSRYLDEPDAVDESWRRFFAGIGDDPAALKADRAGPAWAHSARPAPAIAAAASGTARQEATDSIRALNLIRAYRVRGHLEADLDPLGIEKRANQPELDYRTYGFSRPISIAKSSLIICSGASGRPCAKSSGCCAKSIAGASASSTCTSRCSPNGDGFSRNSSGSTPDRVLTNASKKEILRVLTGAETFERFLDRRYTGTKRFGIEGAELLMPALEAILRVGTELGIEEFVLGMPHRGRLSVLANFMGKPYAAIFSEFQGNASSPEHVHGSGDVKYHLGTSADRDVGGRLVHLSLAANPSHLEAVNPVVLGKARAKQRQREDSERKKVAGHPDAWRRRLRRPGPRRRVARICRICAATAPAARSILSPTTRSGSPRARRKARSSPYPSDIAKGIQAPIFHVNGDHPEAVVEVARAVDRVPPALRQGRGDRPVLLSPPRAQRGRRAGLYAAPDVPHDRAPPDDAAALCRKAHRRWGAEPGRVERRPSRVRRQPGNPSSMLPRITGRTRRTGSKAPGPVSSRLPI